MVRYGGGERFHHKTWSRDATSGPQISVTKGCESAQRTGQDRSYPLSKGRSSRPRDGPRPLPVEEREGETTGSLSRIETRRHKGQIDRFNLGDPLRRRATLPRRGSSGRGLVRDERHCSPGSPRATLGDR